MLLYGTVKSDADARNAENIAKAYFGLQPPTTVTTYGSSASGGSSGGSASSAGQRVETAGPTASVINLLTIQGQDQVHLKVTVAEVQRNIVKQLGVDLNGAITLGQF